MDTTGHFCSSDEKYDLVRSYLAWFQSPVLIETGTYKGGMIAAIKDLCSEIYSIELDQDLYERATKRFVTDENIHLFQGDSAVVLPRILTHIHSACVFWLDGHFSGGITACGTKQTPIWEELQTIVAHPGNAHVILIDDVRCFGAKKDYPTVDEIRSLIMARYPNFIFEVKDDVIRAHPPKAT